MNWLLSFYEGLVHTNLLTCKTIAMLLRRYVHRNVLRNTRPVVGGVGHQLITLRKEPFKPWTG